MSNSKARGTEMMPHLGETPALLSSSQQPGNPDYYDTQRERPGQAVPCSCLQLPTIRMKMAWSSVAASPIRGGR